MIIPAKRIYTLSPHQLTAATYDTLLHVPLPTPHPPPCTMTSGDVVGDVTALSSCSIDVETSPPLPHPRAW